MNPARVLLAVAVIGIVATLTAAAATLAIDAATLGVGRASISRCDPDGFTPASFTTSRGKVTSVTVTGIADACRGGRLTVNLVQGDSSGASGGSVAVAGSSETVAVSGSIDAWNVDGFRAVVIGP